MSMAWCVCVCVCERVCVVIPSSQDISQCTVDLTAPPVSRLPEHSPYVLPSFRQFRDTLTGATRNIQRDKKTLGECGKNFEAVGRAYDYKLKGRSDAKSRYSDWFDFSTLSILYFRLNFFGDFLRRSSCPAAEFHIYGENCVQASSTTSTV